MELDSAKAVSPEGEGRPSCSWAGRLLRRGQQGAGNPSLLLATAESRQFQPRKGSNCAKEGSHWGCAALRSWERELHGTFIWSSVTGEREYIFLNKQFFPFVFKIGKRVQGEPQRIASLPVGFLCYPEEETEVQRCQQPAQRYKTEERLSFFSSSVKVPQGQGLGLTHTVTPARARGLAIGHGRCLLS